MSLRMLDFRVLTPDRGGSGQRGSGMVEALIGLAVLGGAAAFAMTVMQNSYKMQRAIEQRDAFSSVRTLVSTKINCEATLKPFGMPPVCNGAGVALRDRGDAIFVQPGGTDFDKNGASTAVRAICRAGGIEVQVGRRRAGVWLRDALTDEMLDFNSTRSQALGTTQLCTGSFSPKPIKFLTGTQTVANDAANTTRAPTWIWVTVPTPWRAKFATASVEGSHSTNSSGECRLNGNPILGPNSVRWRVLFRHGNHLHATGCGINYLISNE